MIYSILWSEPVFTLHYPLVFQCLGRARQIPSMSNSIPKVLVTRSLILPSGGLRLAQSPWKSKPVSNHVFFFLPLISCGKMFYPHFDVRNAFFPIETTWSSNGWPKVLTCFGLGWGRAVSCWELVKRQEFDCHPVDVSEIRRLPVGLLGYPIISKLLFIPGGYFGFLPSTVCLFIFWKQMWTEEEKESLWPCNCSRHCDICQKEGGKDSVC